MMAEGWAARFATSRNREGSQVMVSIQSRGRSLPGPSQRDIRRAREGFQI